MSQLVATRTQPFDLYTKNGVANSTPSNCTFNFADTNSFLPSYPTETAMDLQVQSVVFPSVLPAVQAGSNDTFYIIAPTGKTAVRLPQGNFTGGLAGVATTVKTALNAYTFQQWDVTANITTNTLTFTAPAALTARVYFSFQDQVINNTTYPVNASACSLLGFPQTEEPIFAAGQSVTSTQPCQASGPNNVIIACDLYSPDAATVDLFGSTRRGSVLAKINLVDQPWTNSTYFDPSGTFRLRLPAYNISQFTIYLLNEDLQIAEMSIHWSMSGTVTYYTPSPMIQIQQTLESINQTLTYIWLDNKHGREDSKKHAKQQLQAIHNLQELQGRLLEQ